MRSAAGFLLPLALLCSLPALAQEQRFTLEVHDATLADVLRLLSAEAGRNVVADGSIRAQRVTLRLAHVDFEEALTVLVNAYGLQVHRDGQSIIVGDSASMNRRFADNGESGGVQTTVFGLTNAKPEDVLPLLQAALPPGTVVLADRRTNALIVTAGIAATARARLLLAALDAPAFGPAASLRTTAIQLHDVRASDVIKSLKGTLPDGAAIADDRRNTVIVTGNEGTQDAARALLEALDGPGREVMFEVRVADVQPLNDQIDVGLTFGGAGYGTTGALGVFPYTVTARSLMVNAQIDTLVQHGRATILAQPRIATLNNHEASLLIGSQYPVVTVNQQTGYPSVQTVDVGVRLRLTPTIGDDGTVTAELHPEYSQIVGFNSSFPIIANRKIDSTLRVRDGETIVLGGLFEDVDNETVTKFPLLSDLPVLGSIFRNRQRSHTKDDVVFLITPHILSPDGHASSAP
jgi:type II secretory pathway component GspD/PulD (secretin)